jgi:NADPH:quinone reductase
MKAVQFKSFGTPEVLEYLELPTPQCDSDSAIVRIASASVNPSDVKNLSGHFEHTVLPRIPGRDFSGVVVEGPIEWGGAEVWGTGGDIGFTRDGTHADFIKIPLAALARKPSTLSHEEASAIGVNFVIAWLGTVDYAQLSAGETVAVIGVGGGVGGAATQIAKALGARVIGIDRHAPSPDSPAGKLIDAYVPFDESTVERVRKLTGGDLGANMWEQPCARCTDQQHDHQVLRQQAQRHPREDIQPAPKRARRIGILDHYRHPLARRGGLFGRHHPVR